MVNIVIIFIPHSWFVQPECHHKDSLSLLEIWGSSWQGCSNVVARKEHLMSRFVIPTKIKQQRQGNDSVLAWQECCCRLLGLLACGERQENRVQVLKQVVYEDIRRRWNHSICCLLLHVLEIASHHAPCHYWRLKMMNDDEGKQATNKLCQHSSQSTTWSTTMVYGSKKWFGKKVATTGSINLTSLYVWPALTEMLPLLPDLLRDVKYYDSTISTTY